MGELLGIRKRSMLLSQRELKAFLTSLKSSVAVISQWLLTKMVSCGLSAATTMASLVSPDRITGSLSLCQFQCQEARELFQTSHVVKSTLLISTHEAMSTLGVTAWMDSSVTAARLN